MPSMAFFEILMTIKIIGSITGKPNIAIRVLLLLALAAILEIIVKEVEKPRAPKKIPAANNA